MNGKDPILLNSGDPVRDFPLRLSVSAGERNTYRVASADLVTSVAEHGVRRDTR